jgi:hypothetical protein
MNFVVAAHHVGDGCFGFVVGSRMGAREASVGGTFAQSMGVAATHPDIVNDDVMGSCGSSGGGSSSSSDSKRGSRNDGGLMGAVKSGRLGSEFAEALLVFKVEMSSESGESLIGKGLVTPFLNGRRERSCLFENGEGEADGSVVGDCFERGSKCLAIADANPNVFHGIVNQE